MKYIYGGAGSGSPYKTEIVVEEEVAGVLVPLTPGKTVKVIGISGPGSIGDALLVRFYSSTGGVITDPAYYYHVRGLDDNETSETSKESQGPSAQAYLQHSGFPNYSFELDIAVPVSKSKDVGYHIKAFYGQRSSTNKLSYRKVRGYLDISAHWSGFGAVEGLYITNNQGNVRVGTKFLVLESD
jgi:hypothetical protein